MASSSHAHRLLICERADDGTDHIAVMRRALCNPRKQGTTPENLSREDPPDVLPERVGLLPVVEQALRRPRARRLPRHPRPRPCCPSPWPISPVVVCAEATYRCLGGCRACRRRSGSVALI